jgi:hypothetical protein
MIYIYIYIVNTFVKYILSMKSFLLFYTSLTDRPIALSFADSNKYQLFVKQKYGH